MRLRIAVMTLVSMAMLLSGCASVKARPPALGIADTGGFNASGATVSVVYECDHCGGAQLGKPGVNISDKALEKRHDEFFSVLQSHGFHPVAASTPADYQVRVYEGWQSREPNSNGLMILSTFTLYLLPTPWTETSKYKYELLSNGAPIHELSTTSTKHMVAGWVSLPFLVMASSVQREARVATHQSAVGLWIEQGSFD